MSRVPFLASLLTAFAFLAACSGRCCPPVRCCGPATVVTAPAPAAAAPDPVQKVAVAPPAAPPKAEPPAAPGFDPLAPAKADAAAKQPAKPADATRQGVRKAVDEIREEVARVRGLAWKKKVPADLLSREELIANIEQMTKDELDPAEYATDLRLMRRLGMLSEKDDPLEMMKAFLGVGVQGYYDPKKKHFFMIDGLSVEGQRPIIFHELTHALDDQYFDLEKHQEAVKKDSDRLFALKCTLEGCAEHARAAYEAAHPEVSKTLANDEQKQAVEQMKVMQKVPAFLVLPTLLHYKLGPAFVGRTVGDDFPGGMKRLYADVPVSQEQVMHPEKYLSDDRDLPQSVTFSPGLATCGGAGCKVLDDDSMGELDVAFWLDFHLGTTGGKLNLAGLAEGRLMVPQARKAAAGWDGARMAFLEKADAPLAILLASAWDTEADAREAGEAMRLAFKRQYGGKFEGADFDEKDGVRRAEWTGPHGLGRIEVAGTKVFLVDGFVAGGMDLLFAEVAKTKFAKDSRDTWDPSKIVDPVREAAWKDEERGVGWNPPSREWSITKDDSDDELTWLRKADGPRIRLTTGEGGLLVALQAHLAKVKDRLPKGFNLMKAVSDATVAGKTAGRFAWTESTASGDVKHQTMFVALESGTVVVDVEAPEAEWAAAEKAYTEALKGFVARDD